MILIKLGDRRAQMVTVFRRRNLKFFPRTTTYQSITMTPLKTLEIVLLQTLKLRDTCDERKPQNYNNELDFFSQ
jgi:hypothetical protein